MATAGITIYNSDKKIQIDGAYKNLYLSRKINLSKAGNTSGTFSEGEVLAAVGGTTSQSIDAYCRNTPTGWTCTVNTFVSGMKVYVFTMNAPQTTHGSGLQVFDKNGTLVFDSNNKHPKVITFGQKESSASAAVKPALAVAQDVYTRYVGSGSRVTEEYVLESRVINHPDEYGWYEEQEQRYVWVDPVYGMVGGGGTWVGGQYVYESPTWGIVTEGHYEWQTVTVRKWGVVRQGWTEIKNEWVHYYVETPYNWEEWNYENFYLKNGSVKKATVSSGATEFTFLNSYRSTDYIPVKDTKLVTKGIIVDTRSWLLLDVDGL